MNLNSLSLHEKVCQMMVVKANPKKHIKQYGSIKNFMEKYPVGGIFICNELRDDKSIDRKKFAEIIAEYQKYSKIPLLVASDAEQATGFLSNDYVALPPPMAIGSAGDKKLAYDYGKAIAVQCKTVGVNWAFAPVCDMVFNKFNEIVRTRSISNDPEYMCGLLTEEIKGFQENGVMTTGKHFPGDGCDARNQHIVCSKNNLSKEAWLNTYGKVYKAAFEAGMSAVMVGHICVPAFQNDSENGVYPPASLSADAMKLLKEELGFKGVAITDAMDMGGFVRYKFCRREAEVEAFRAGLDMMLWPREETATLIEKALESGEIPMYRLDDAILRIQTFKEKICGIKAEPKSYEAAIAFAVGLKDTLAKKSGTLYKNTLNLIPVKKEKIKKVRIVTSVECFLDTRDRADALADFLAEEFKKHGAEVDLKRSWDVYLEDFEAGEIDRDYDLIVYCAFSSSALPMYSRELVNLHSAQRFDEDKTIVMAIGTPHYLTEYFPLAHTAIHTYPFEKCLEEAVSSIYGESELTGKIPMKNYEIKAF